MTDYAIHSVESVTLGSTGECKSTGTHWVTLEVTEHHYTGTEISHQVTFYMSPTDAGKLIARFAT